MGLIGRIRNSGARARGVPSHPRNRTGGSGPRAIIDLSRNLLKELSGHEANPVISPSCLYLSLAMLADATCGGAHEELKDLLGGTSKIRRVMRSIADIAAPMYGCKDFCYSTGASIWIDDAVGLNEGVASKGNAVPVKIAQVRLGSSDSKAAIGKWLSKNTGGIFTDSPAIAPGSKLIALGAMHLKDSWSKAFDEDEPRFFHYDDDSQRAIPFMLDQDDYCVLESNGSITLSKELSSGCSMIISMPPKGLSIFKYVDRGDAWSNIESFLDGAYSECEREYKIFLPKFDLSSSDLDLNEMLIGMGVSRIFESTDAFAPLSPAHLVVDAVQQSTRLSIDEEGLEGASYVEIVMYNGLPLERSQKPKEVVFDRPFVVVVTSPRKDPMFLGIVTHPKE